MSVYEDFMEKKKLDPVNDKVQIPITHLPLFRTEIAIQAGVEKNLLFRTWGGLGDQICAEPTLRYALQAFKDCEISLASEQPELFGHLKFERVFNLKQERPIYENYFVFETITPPDDSNLVWQFFSHMLVHCVDFPSMCALRSQLPNADKELKIVPERTGLKFENLSQVIADRLATEKCVVVHPGRHWQSKTFPKLWWDLVLHDIFAQGVTPVLIGADTDDNRGTVDVFTGDCIDLRNKLTVMETIYLLQHSKVLLTNDSAPLHMAATGDAWIGFVATCKHPDYISHWRKGEFSWRMKNFGKGGIWDVIDHCPNRASEVSAEAVDPELLKSWLPDPKEFAEWAVSKT